MIDFLTDKPIISLIIPARNEEAHLPKLLDTIAEAKERYHRGPGAVEVIVVNNGSTDNTAAIAEQRGALVVFEERRIIAAVRNAGAVVATGDFLAFIDADSRIHPETFNVIDRKLSNLRIIGGATGVRLDRWSPGILVTYIILVSMVWILGMDTGVVFCRKADFEAIGGYDETRRVAEDVRFIYELKRLGRRHNQRLIRATEAKAITSMRKFDRHGDWYYMGLISRFFRGILSGRDVLDEVADLYWYDR